MYLYLYRLTKCITVLLLALSMSLLSACQREWYFTIVDIGDQNHPQFCFGRFKECDEHGVGFSLMNIDEVDRKGGFVRSMWAIRPRENKNLKKVIYGIPPDGYMDIIKAEPLEMDKWYSVHGEFFFRMIQDGKQLKAEVYNQKEFIEKP